MYNFNDIQKNTWNRKIYFYLQERHTSTIRWRAESVPIVISVPQKSLSIDATIPTMWNFWNWSCSTVLILPLSNKFFTWVGHSSRSKFAPKYENLRKSFFFFSRKMKNQHVLPVRDPSPPITHKCEILFFIRFKAAFSRPSEFLKSAHRAEPITVPPSSIIPETSYHSVRWIFSPPSIRP